MGEAVGDDNAAILINDLNTEYDISCLCPPLSIFLVYCRDQDLIENSLWERFVHLTGFGGDCNYPLDADLRDAGEFRVH